MADRVNGVNGMVVPFRPNRPNGLALLAPQSRAVQQLQQQQQPQFVVFELLRQQQSQEAVQQQHWAVNGPEFQMPFLPFGNSQSPKLLENDDEPQQQNSAGRGQTTVSPAGVNFTTVQLSPDHPMMNPNIRIGPATSTSTALSGGRGRLLFDNPMFRRLPNWHFFGDDRRLARIPSLMIPLVPVPVERTLLYIAPSVSSSRQLLLFTLLDLKRRAKAIEAVDFEAEGSRPNSSLEPEDDEEEEDGTLLPECPSTSGVESMSSEETATTARSSPAMTPDGDEGHETSEQWMRTPTPPMVAEDDVEEAESLPQRPQDSSSSSPSSDSVSSSSTPNSPPTFDRRIVRMSRGTRDAVRRLSRRYCEEEDEEEWKEDDECRQGGENALINAVPLANPVPAAAPPVISMISSAGQTTPPNYRNRRGSAGSNCSSSANNKRPQPSSASDDAISRMDVLSERILNFHQNEEQTQLQLNRKLQLRDQLYYAISPIFPMCGLYIVGSSLNGFGTSLSDLDLCLMITNRDIDQRSDAVVVLSSVMRTLESNKMVGEQKLILAKVPILRIKFHGTFSDIMVDLNVNNSVAIRNTHLMCYYSNYDWRVRALVNIVKEWAKRHGINNASCSSFTSYSLVLMVIHYLQCGANPPVLPNLQEMYTRRFNGRADVRTLNVSLPLDPLPHTLGWKFKEDMTLSELLIGFLHYYAYQFDFDVDAISIRMGRKVNRAQVAQNQSPFNTLSQWHCICIEEPFTLSNAAHSVYDERIFQDIKKTFVDSYHELDKYRDLDRFLGPPVKTKSSSTVGSDVEDGERVIIANGQQQNGTTTAETATETAGTD